MKFDRLILIVLAALVFLLAFMSLQRGGLKDGYSTESANPPDFSAAVELVMPAVVKIEGDVLRGHPALPGLTEPGEVAQTSEGTGFFIDRDGTLLTNYHVIAGAENLRVVTRDEKSYPAEVIGGDMLTDVALIRIKPDFRVTPVVLGDSSRLKVGQWVLAMGNPLGLEFFTTAGIVSGFGPPGPNYLGFFDFIQVDMNIKPGNSGGPLITPRGEVVGINNAYMGPGTGIGFAIPINRAKEDAVLLRKGPIRRGFLGIIGQPLTPGLAERLGLAATRGALVSDVLENSPAYEAGLKPGDVVLEYEMRPVANDRDLEEKVFNTAPGRIVEMLAYRDGMRFRLTVQMGELREHLLIEQRIARQCGITLKKIPEDAAKSLGMTDANGLLVLKVVPGCPSYEGGLRFGDIIRKVEGKVMYSEADFYKAYSQTKVGSQVLLQVLRGGRPLYLTIRQGEQ